MSLATATRTCLCGHEALAHFDDCRHCSDCECTLFRRDPIPETEPHRLCTVDLRYVTKTVYPDAAAAQAAAEELTARFGGLWFAAHHSYFKNKVDPEPGHDPITTIKEAP